MAEAGAKVTLTDIDAEGAAREAQRLSDEGHTARWDVCDVAKLDEVARAFDKHVRAYGGCDIAFANAGLDVGNGFWTPEGKRNPDGQIDVYDPDRWYKSIGINLTGVFHTVREAARVMKANEQRPNGRRGGSIVITSSNAAEVNEAIVGVPYMAAKAGVKHFMRHAAYELAAYGIRVNAIAPGPFVTNIGDGWVKKNPAAKAAWDELVPVGKMAETYQIKPLALLLASDAGSYMTGAHVMIDGGMQLGPVKPLNE
jgi:NAD(P)-dependent dehydrogenase (short-subunit alcohol dehydrogenase family)